MATQVEDAGIIRRNPMSSIAIRWQSFRAFSFPASVMPALLGIALAWSEGYSINIWFALLTIFGAVAAHCGANLINDYIDFKRGIDRADTESGSRVIVDGLLTPTQVLVSSAIAFAVAAAAFIPLWMSVGNNLLWLVIAGFILAAGYVLPPFRFKYRALGDVAVFSAFGLGIGLGSYAIQSHAFLWAPVVYAIPQGLLVAAIVHANNMRDLDDDHGAMVKTMAGIVGIGGSRALYTTYVVGAYLLIVAFVLTRYAVPSVSIALLTFPIAWKMIKKIWRAKPPLKDSLTMADAGTAQLNIAFGLAFIVGIIAWRVIVPHL